MLTKNELDWLERRETLSANGNLYYCNHCDKPGRCGLTRGQWYYCPLFVRLSNYIDTAEFEARVAAKLSDSCWHQYVKWETPIKPNLTLFQRSKDRLKHARIEVEEEMENEY